MSADIYDLRGLNCPLPVLKTRKRLETMPGGSRLWVETSDPLAVIDMPNFCLTDGHRLIETVTIEGGHRFHIERG
ncbi:sulfurtransferase TusA family protein [Phyllobacterium sp. 22229]|uniref:Response regulator SirA n=1 Tax=Phyllobacterium myrsinacearum TaxID=28101 RepID=A0A2S9JK57_9HYPH|nr:sulfurtransferase TusA family protein [Phyllobacterium myrsinacearum]PRD53489.1 response regulator SirA [Phyllobacterium myrsinacearum]PWV86942.1 tRNA 2-thiouridine synthesizing protein A [Phyllobacterium myrsinacearum]RZV07946.1 tRNA 2-thiouridine synthesizing protein A [Phyllobacterium myrsinacearum]